MGTTGITEARPARAIWDGVLEQMQVVLLQPSIRDGADPAALVVHEPGRREPVGDPVADRHERIISVAAAEAMIRAGASERRSQEPEYIPLREWDELMLPADRGIFR